MNTFYNLRKFNFYLFNLKGIQRLFIALVLLALISGCSSTPITTNTDTETGDTHKSIELATIKPKEATVPVPEKAKALFSEAITQMKQGKSTAAESIFIQLTTEYPTLSGPFLNLGILYLKEDKIEAATKMLQHVLSLKPASAEAHDLLGVINREQGHFKEAEKEYLAAINADKNYAPAHLNLGILYDLYMGQLESALKEYKMYNQINTKKVKKVNQWIRDLQRRLKKKGK